jgi:hypothetical protein
LGYVGERRICGKRVGLMLVVVVVVVVVVERGVGLWEEEGWGGEGRGRGMVEGHVSGIVLGSRFGIEGK